MPENYIRPSPKGKGGPSPSPKGKGGSSPSPKGKGGSSPSPKARKNKPSSKAKKNKPSSKKKNKPQKRGRIRKEGISIMVQKYAWISGLWGYWIDCPKTQTASPSHTRWEEWTHASDSEIPTSITSLNILNSSYTDVRKKNMKNMTENDIKRHNYLRLLQLFTDIIMVPLSRTQSSDDYTSDVFEYLNKVCTELPDTFPPSNANRDFFNTVTRDVVTTFTSLTLGKCRTALATVPDGDEHMCELKASLETFIISSDLQGLEDFYTIGEILSGMQYTAQELSTPREKQAALMQAHIASVIARFGRDQYYIIPKDVKSNAMRYAGIVQIGYRFAE